MFGKGKDPARIGLTAHTAILHKLVSVGFEVLQPFSDELRYAYNVPDRNRTCDHGSGDQRSIH